MVKIPQFLAQALHVLQRVAEEVVQVSETMVALVDLLEVLEQEEVDEAQEAQELKTKAIAEELVNQAIVL